MRIAYLTAGAGGMYCGSCLHDNTLAAALIRLGHEVALIPTYTPIRTDEEDVSREEIFFGAVNVYLAARFPWWHRVPSLVERLLDHRGWLRWVSRLGSSTDPAGLGFLAVAVLRAEQGPLADELARLSRWLREVYQPEVVHITNSMFLGFVHRLKEELGVPVVVNVQGEDLFLDQLPSADRELTLEEMRRRAAEPDAFVAPSHYYAEHMGALLGIAPHRCHVIPLGVRLETVPDRRAQRSGTTLGYLARICPEKGLHLLVDAFGQLARSPGGDSVRLRIAGYLGRRDRPFFAAQRAKIAAWGLADRVDFVGEVDRAGKADFLSTLDLLAVPTIYREPKGLFVLEALSAGVPVVLPHHGSFPELLEATDGGVLFEPGSVTDLESALSTLVADTGRRQRLGETGRRAVRESFSDTRMAQATVDLYRRLQRGER